jgi:hypothetical protein
VTCPSKIAGIFISPHDEEFATGNYKRFCSGAWRQNILSTIHPPLR